MKSLLKYWYFLAVALIVSLASAFGLIYMRKDAWMPKEVPSTGEPVDLSEGDSIAFREWGFKASQLEDLNLRLDGREAELQAREHSLNSLRAQIENERKELIDLRKSLEALSASMDEKYISMENAEMVNLKKLASIYSEIKADAAIKVFGGLDDETTVKILSLMPSEAAARVLSAMANSVDESVVERAATLTNDLRKIKN